MATFSETIEAVRESRSASEAALKNSPVPSGSASGVFASSEYKVTAADAVNGYVDFSFDLVEVFHFIVQVRDQTGAIKPDDFVVSMQDESTVRVANGSSASLADTDIVTIIVRGKV